MSEIAIDINCVALVSGESEQFLSMLKNHGGS